MKSTLSLFLLLFLVLTKVSNAQTNDAGLWLSGAIEKKFTQRVYMEGKVALRFKDNVSSLASFYGDLGVGYKLMKGLKIEAHYRYSEKTKQDKNNDERQRYYADLTYKLKTGTPIKISFRLRLQKQYANLLTSDKGAIPKNAIRLAAKVAYGYKKYEPFVSAELYYLFDQPENYFKRIRYKAGVEYELNKRNSFTVYYMIQKQLNKIDPLRSFVVGLSYNYTF